MTEVKEKKTRTPKNANSIMQGAIKMSLADKVKLRDHLNDWIESEVELKKQEFEQAEKIANGGTK